MELSFTERYNSTVQYTTLSFFISVCTQNVPQQVSQSHSNFILARHVFQFY